MAELSEYLVIKKADFDKLLLKIDKISEVVLSKNTCNKTYMTMEEVCEYLGVSDVTIYSYIKNFNLPSTKIGNRRRFSREEVDNWLAMQK